MLLSTLLTTVSAFTWPAAKAFHMQSAEPAIRGLDTSSMLCGTRSFDVALQSILSRADAVGSARIAIEDEFHALDETFIPALTARLNEAQSNDRLWNVMDAIGEVLDRPELMQKTAADEIIGRHWRGLDGFWTIDEAEERAVDMDGVAEDSETGKRASTYGEITRAGGRQLFFAMGLTAAAARKGARAPVFMDLGSGAGRLVVQAWLELAPTSVIQSAVGVELAPSRHAAAEKGWASVVAAGDAPPAAALAEAGVTAAAPSLLLDSILEVDLSQATHVYVASLEMSDELLDALWLRLCDEAPRLEVVASIREFRAAGAAQPPTQVVPIAMNWNGSCKVHLYTFGR